MDNSEKLRRLRKACVWGRVQWDKLVMQCQTGECQFHEVEDAVCVTTLEVSDAGKACYIVVGAGTLTGYVNLQEKVEAFARGAGCNALYAIARPGFTKFYEKMDPEFKPVAVKFEKILK